MKSKPVAKKKRKTEIVEVFDPKAQRKAEKQLRNHIMELDERSEEREINSRLILDENEATIEDVVDQIIESLKKMHTLKGEDVRLTFKGQVFRPVGEEAQLLKRIQERNFRYIAVRLLVALAEWDVRVDGFKLPKHKCARCGKKVSK